MCVWSKCCVFEGSVHYPRTALFWTKTLDVVTGICWSYFSSFRFIAPIAIITGTTLDFTFQICSSYSFSSWYFSVFLCYFFLILLSATSIRTSVFFCLSATTITWFVSQQLVCLEIEDPQEFTPFVLLWHRDLGTSTPYAAQMFFGCSLVVVGSSNKMVPAWILHPVLCVG